MVKHEQRFHQTRTTFSKLFTTTNFAKSKLFAILAKVFYTFTTPYTRDTKLFAKVTKLWTKFAGKALLFAKQMRDREEKDL